MLDWFFIDLAGLLEDEADGYGFDELGYVVDEEGGEYGGHLDGEEAEAVVVGHCSGT